MNIDKSKAIVTTSKFLEIKKKVDNDIRTANSNNGVHGISATEYKVQALEWGFDNLCKLLHEMVMGD